MGRLHSFELWGVSEKETSNFYKKLIQHEIAAVAQVNVMGVYYPAYTILTASCYWVDSDRHSRNGT